MIAAEAHATLASGPDGVSTAPTEPWSTWIAPSPVSVKLRLFCLPYAGGVSENVFARYDPALTCSLAVQMQHVLLDILMTQSACFRLDMCFQGDRCGVMVQVGDDAAGQHPGVPRGAARARAAAEGSTHQRRRRPG